MRLPLITYVSGLLFGLGLCVSGMVRPTKALAFLNVLGSWDPTLMVVLGTAAAIYFVWHLYMKDKLSGLPLVTAPVDKRLVIGSIIFGCGWGLIGFCPGPAVAALAGGEIKVVVFLAAMSAGLLLADKVRPTG